MVGTFALLPLYPILRVDCDLNNRRYLAVSYFCQYFDIDWSTEIRSSVVSSFLFWKENFEKKRGENDDGHFLSSLTWTKRSAGVVPSPKGLYDLETTRTGPGALSALFGCGGCCCCYIFCVCTPSWNKVFGGEESVSALLIYKSVFWCYNTGIQSPYVEHKSVSGNSISG